MRITSKGQITVPKALRERFGITPHSELEFKEDRGRLVLVKMESEAQVTKLRGRLKRLPIGHSVDGYLDAIRGGK